MPRRARIVRRAIAPDALYQNVMVQRVINKILQDGKKSVAERIVYGSLKMIEEQTNRDPIETFELAMRNVTPLLEVRPRRGGWRHLPGAYGDPGDRRVSLAIRWLVGAARARSGRTITDKLAGELLDASRNQGSAIKRREDTHRMAEANKAFAHYRW